MGILLLAIFVVGSIAFSCWAWKSYDAVSQRELDGPTDRPALVIMIVSIVLYSSLIEVLAHYTKWSFKERFGVAAAVGLLFQYLAFRVLNRVRQKA
jgi:hypothetical protein